MAVLVTILIHSNESGMILGLVALGRQLGAAGPIFIAWPVRGGLLSQRKTGCYQHRREMDAEQTT